MPLIQFLREKICAAFLPLFHSHRRVRCHFPFFNKKYNSDFQLRSFILYFNLNEPSKKNGYHNGSDNGGDGYCGGGAGCCNQHGSMPYCGGSNGSDGENDVADGDGGGHGTGRVFSPFAS